MKKIIFGIIAIFAMFVIVPSAKAATTKNDVKATLSNTSFEIDSAVNKAMDDATLSGKINVKIDTTTVPATLDNFVLNYVVITVQGLPVAP